MKSVTCAAVLALSVPVAYGQLSTIQGDSGYYYRIGGAAPLAYELSPFRSSVRIGGGASLGLGYSCGQFDPIAALADTLDQLARGVSRTAAAVQGAIGAAVAGLPLLIIQRVSPDLYDLFQTFNLGAQSRIDFAFKSCEALEQDIRAGNNPYRDWISVSMGDNLRRTIGGGATNIVTAVEDVTADAGDNGVPWIGGTQAAGAGMPPIRTVRDTVRAGYNVRLRRPAADTSAPVFAGTPPRLAQIWSSPAEAEDWATQVLGDEEIRICNGCVPNTTPGVGLHPLYTDQLTDARTALTDLLTGASAVTPANLADASAPQLEITPQVLMALRRLPDSESRLLAARLADDVAYNRIIERSLAARRLLLTGRQVPAISSYGLAQERINDAVIRLERELELFRFDRQVRRETISDTALTILARDAQHATAIDQRPVPPRSDRVLEGGAVR